MGGRYGEGSSTVRTMGCGPINGGSIPLFLPYIIVRKFIMRNQENYKNYQREYQKKYYEERRKRAIKELGNKCTYCGKTENLNFAKYQKKYENLI